jgi:hypothetical protein
MEGDPSDFYVVVTKVEREVRRHVDLDNVMAPTPECRGHGPATLEGDFSL